MTEHLADAVEAVARMLPGQVPGGGQYDVARTVLAAADEHLAAHYGRNLLEQLRNDLQALHRPSGTDEQGLQACVECWHTWPCATRRLLVNEK